MVALPGLQWSVRRPHGAPRSPCQAKTRRKVPASSQEADSAGRPVCRRRHRGLPAGRATGRTSVAGRHRLRGWERPAQTKAILPSGLQELHMQRPLRHGVPKPRQHLPQGALRGTHARTFASL